MVGFTVELDYLAPQSNSNASHDCLPALQVRIGEHAVPIFGDEHQVGVEDVRAVASGADATQLGCHP